MDPIKEIGWLPSEEIPQASHQTHKGRRGAVVGQGELKKIGFDPLFSLNHTCAMLRANISRLVRRTWATTKRADRLKDHLFVYMDVHNSELIKKSPGIKPEMTSEVILSVLV